MTAAQARAHQEKHGFGPKNAITMPLLSGLPTGGGKLRQMNKTEASFALILEAQKRRGEIVHYVYEGITLKWGDVMRYTPDFIVFTEGEIDKLIEVKGGFIRDRDLVRFKGCRAEWKTWFDFELWQKKAGSWTRLE